MHVSHRIFYTLMKISVHSWVISKTGSASSCNRCLFWMSWICFILKARNGNRIPLTLILLTQVYRDKMGTILQTHFLVCFYQLKTLANCYVMWFLAKCARYWYSKNCINTRSFYSWINNIGCSAHALSSAETSWAGFRKNVSYFGICSMKNTHSCVVRCSYQQYFVESCDEVSRIIQFCSTGFTTNQNMAWASTNTMPHNTSFISLLLGDLTLSAFSLSMFSSKLHTLPMHTGHLNYFPFHSFNDVLFIIRSWYVGYVYRNLLHSGLTGSISVEGRRH